MEEELKTRIAKAVDLILNNGPFCKSYPPEPHNEECMKAYGLLQEVLRVLSNMDADGLEKALDEMGWEPGIYP